MAWLLDSTEYVARSEYFSIIQLLVRIVLYKTHFNYLYINRKYKKDANIIRRSNLLVPHSQNLIQRLGPRIHHISIDFYLPY